jgi:hypothetical protein
MNWLCYFLVHIRMVELQRKLYMNWLYNFATKQMWKRSLYIVTEYGLTD